MVGIMNNSMLYLGLTGQLWLVVGVLSQDIFTKLLSFLVAVFCFYFLYKLFMNYYVGAF
jgi:hypothetical protein